MIFRKGTEVEVLERGKGPFESWRPAKIISGNGHTYAVKYVTSSLENAAPMNKVPRKALRPWAPIQTKCWVCADIVEMLDDGSWKLAQVVMIHDSHNVVARLVNLSKEIVAPTFRLRMPLTWRDGHWIPLHQGSMDCKELDVNGKAKRRILPLFSAVEKRSLVSTHDGGFRKKQKIQENETTSSVGNCSLFDGLLSSAHQMATRRQKQCSQEDDAESFCGSSTGRHRLEFDAYRSTLRSLYASGPLSWDQESFLTELHHALNITNDEHLAEVKDLLSTGR